MADDPIAGTGAGIGAGTGDLKGAGALAGTAAATGTDQARAEDVTTPIFVAAEHQRGFFFTLT